MNTLPELIVAEWSHRRFPCTACGHVYCGTRVASLDPMQSQPGVSFEIFGCEKCGHVMRWGREPEPPRDLTRAEAAELAVSPDFPRVREVVEAAVKHLMG